MLILRTKNLAHAAAFAGAALLCLSGHAVEVGKAAPSVEAKLLDGEGFNLAAEKGHVVIVNFWATWCPPCRQEMPALESYYRAHKGEGLRIVAISMDDMKDEGEVRKVMGQYSYSAALKGDAKYTGYGRIWRMPMTFVIDREGILRKDGSTGDPKVDLPMLENVVTPLLKRGAS